MPSHAEEDADTAGAEGIGRRTHFTKRSITREASDFLDAVISEKGLYVGRDRLFNYLRRQYPEMFFLRKRGNAEEPTYYTDANGQLKEKTYFQPLLSRRIIYDWLQRQNWYAIHNRVRNDKTVQRQAWVKPYLKVQIDLVDMSHIPDKGYKWLFTCIDAFSKKAWVVPMKDKTEASVLDALREIFDVYMVAKPKYCQSDNGKEFTSGGVRKFFESRGIEQVFSMVYRPQSNGLVERFNQAIKRSISLHREHSGTAEWVDRLPQLVDTYNWTIHNTTKQAPNDIADPRDEESEEQRQARIRILRAAGLKPNSYPWDTAKQGRKPVNKIAAQEYKVGDLVRIRLNRLKSAIQWSSEPYRVVRVHFGRYGPGYHRTTYDIASMDGVQLDARKPNDQLMHYIQPDQDEENYDKAYDPLLDQFSHIEMPVGPKRELIPTLPPAYWVAWKVPDKWQRYTLEQRTSLDEPPFKDILSKFDKAHKIVWLQSNDAQGNPTYELENNAWKSKVERRILRVDGLDPWKDKFFPWNRPGLPPTICKNDRILDIKDGIQLGKVKTRHPPPSATRRPQVTQLDIIDRLDGAFVYNNEPYYHVLWMVQPGRDASERRTDEPRSSLAQQVATVVKRYEKKNNVRWMTDANGRLTVHDDLMTKRASRSRARRVVSDDEEEEEEEQQDAAARIAAQREARNARYMRRAGNSQ